MTVESQFSCDYCGHDATHVVTEIDGCKTDVLVCTDHQITVMKKYSRTVSHALTPPELKCDFCSSTAIVWDYVCDEIALSSIAYDGVLMQGMTPEWVACDPCKQLIDQRMLGALIERVVNTFPTPLTDVQAMELKNRYLRPMYSILFDTLKGEGKPI